MKKKENQSSAKRRGPIRENLESIVIAIIMAFIIKGFVLEVFKIPTGSMEPTLMGSSSNGDRIIVVKPIFKLSKPKRWTVAVFLYPRIDLSCDERYHSFRLEGREDVPTRCPSCGSTRFGPRRKNYIKRIVGLPGETVEIRDGDILINGKLVEKPPPVRNVYYTQPPQGEYAVTGPLQLGDDEYFALGDNTRNSRDSRYWGPVPGDNLVGKALVILWPYGRWQVIH